MTLTTQESATQVAEISLPQNKQKQRRHQSPDTRMAKPSVMETYQDFYPQNSQCQVLVTEEIKRQGALWAYLGRLSLAVASVCSTSGNQALKGELTRQALPWTSACSVTNTAKNRVQNRPAPGG